jgi:hypothetical protein
MRKFKSYMLISIPVILSLLLGACVQSPAQDLTATPLEVPKEASPGEYINVIIQVASDQPCKIVLTTPHKTEIDNYLAPHTTDTLTYPNSDGTVVFHEQIPWETAPGNYILKVFQMTHDSNQEGKEIFSQDLIVQ